MKKMFALQLAVILVFSGGFLGMLAATDVYEEIHDNIVNVLCLSCLKLNSKTELSYTNQTATGGDYPVFLTENLSKGPILLHYSQDVCHGCEIMLPVLQNITNLDYAKKDTIATEISFDGGVYTYYYINNDHAPELLKDTYEVFDVAGIGARPMFVLLTYDCQGVDCQTEIVYSSQIGVLGGDSYQEQYAYVETMMEEALDMWESHHEDYQE